MCKSLYKTKHIIYYQWFTEGILRLLTNTFSYVLKSLFRWVWITVASVVPMVFVFFTYNILPESPRWLITTGRLVEAEATIRKIAEVNKAQVPEDLTARLKAMSNQVWSLIQISFGDLSNDVAVGKKILDAN